MIIVFFFLISLVLYTLTTFPLIIGADLQYQKTGNSFPVIIHTSQNKKNYGIWITESFSILGW